MAVIRTRHRMRGFANTANGPNPMEVAGQQNIELAMDQWEFTIGFSF